MRKAKILIIFASSLLLLIALIIGIYLYHQHMLSLQIEDLNGTEDKHLCQITDEMITKYTQDCKIIRHKMISSGLHDSGIEGIYKDCDNAYSDIKIGSLSGILVSNAYLGKDAEITYKILSQVERGNLRIVITDENNTLLHDIPIDEEIEVTFFAEKDKVYYVKFVGESARFTAELERYLQESSLQQ